MAVFFWDVGHSGRKLTVVSTMFLSGRLETVENVTVIFGCVEMYCFVLAVVGPVFRAQAHILQHKCVSVRITVSQLSTRWMRIRPVQKLGNHILILTDFHAKTGLHT